MNAAPGVRSMTRVNTTDAPRRAQDDEGGAWNELLARLRERMMSLLRRRGVDLHLAEDLTQEALAVVWSRHQEVRTHDRLDAWATSVVLNRLRSHARSLRPVDDLSAGEPPERRRALDPLVRYEARTWLTRRLVALTPDCRRAVSLRIGLAVAPADAARVMGVPRGRLRRLLHEGVAGMRRTSAAAEGRALARAAGVA